MFHEDGCAQMSHAQPAVSEGLLPECSIGMKETRSEDDSS